MSHFVDVSSVLRGAVCDLYSNLVTRPTGAAVRTAIERQVVDIGTPVVTTIDFSKVNLLDFSCADEIVAKLLLRYAEADGLAGYLLFRGIQGEHLDPIETVLERHDLALIGWHEGLAELYGCVSEEERWLWEIVRDDGPIGLGDASATLGTSTDDTEALLGQLFRRRLIMHHETGYMVPGTLPKAS